MMNFSSDMVDDMSFELDNSKEQVGDIVSIPEEVPKTDQVLLIYGHYFCCIWSFPNIWHNIDYYGSQDIDPRLISSKPLTIRTKCCDDGVTSGATNGFLERHFEEIVDCLGVLGTKINRNWVDKEGQKMTQHRQHKVQPKPLVVEQQESEEQRELWDSIVQLEVEKSKFKEYELEISVVMPLNIVEDDEPRFNFEQPILEGEARINDIEQEELEKSVVGKSQNPANFSGKEHQNKTSGALKFPTMLP
ncbi:hypothetical protein GH714_010543 [Hevea brasiliensis]|uniref:Uncharacterized protein n=1 Tax=Hevea brasiliensis TaxID=3981 RepID=A0A6A6MV08_HEVBR|nr:hypothetical protein GH714_010543 [Hevea brasiliensis]